MNIKLGLAALSLASAFAMLPGCASDVPQDEADAEEAAATQDELSANAQRFTGAYQGDRSGIPSFDGLVFKLDGTFFGDIDTGIRCFRAPCPSSAHVDGKFSATKSYLTLSPKSGPSTGFYGRYKYAFAGDKLSLSRASLGPDWKNTLDKASSYCAQPSDCGGQGLIHPMCVGGWTCGESKANSCGYKCGITPPPANEIWPASATKVVAESPGGGFTPPPPPGSTCGIGKAKFSLDRASRVLSFETCAFPEDGSPLHLVTGSKTISAAELAKVNKAMSGLKIATEQLCGADKPFLSVKVTTPAGEKTYNDAFYSCQGGNRTYVNGIDAVFAALRDAAE